MRYPLLLCLALLAAPFALASRDEDKSSPPSKIDRVIGDKESKVAGPEYDGHCLTCDLMPWDQFKNIGSKLDGAGMCVFSSIEMAALAQGLEEMRGYRDWWASVSRGGGWPDQVDKSLAAWWKHKGIAPIPYYQYEGREPDKIFSAIDATGRPFCMTYGWSPRYGSSISHMVTGLGYRGKYAIVLDNNFPSKKTGNGFDENVYEWMSKEELCRRTQLTGGSAWIFCWLTPPPPPPPRSKGSA